MRSCSGCGNQTETRFGPALCPACREEHKRATWRIYNKTTMGRLRRRTYKTSPKGRAAASRGTKKYRQTESGWAKFTAALSRYDRSIKGKVKAARAHTKRRASIVGNLTAEQWQDVLHQHGGRCAYCGCIPAHMEMDHVVPLSRGGAHAKANVVPACRTCNRRKYNKPAALETLHQPGGAHP